MQRMLNHSESRGSSEDATDIVTVVPPMQVLGRPGNGCHTGHACGSVLGTPVRAYRHDSFPTTSWWQVSPLLRAREACIHCWVTHMVGGSVVQLTVSRCVGSSELGTSVRAYRHTSL